MKKYIFFFYLILLTFANSEQKIAYIDMKEILNKSSAGVNITKEIEKKIKTENKKYNSIEEQLKSEEKDLSQKKNILSKEEFDTKVLLLREKMNTFNKEKEQTFLNYEKEKKKKLNNFFSKITPLIEIYVKENSINIVLNEKNLFIASRNFDITNQIIEIVNNNIK